MKNPTMTEKGVSLVYEYDDLIRCYEVLLENNLIKEFLNYTKHQETLRLKTIESSNECKRLKICLDAAHKDITTLNSKLTAARKWLDSERLQRKQVESERDSLANTLEELRRLLLNDQRHKIPDETREKISSISRSIQNSLSTYRTPYYDRLNTINEFDSSSVSEVSISRSEDDLDDTIPRTNRKHRPSYLDEEPVTLKKKKSAVFPITPTAPRAESLESLESDPREEVKENLRTPFLNRLNSRAHNFFSVNSYLSAESCLGCEKPIRRFKGFLKCNDCNAVAHQECRDKVPLPCVPMGTPTKPGVLRTIADCAPSVPPMVPAIVIHCVNEVEQRGLSEVGIYRIPGNAKEVQQLREKFSKSKGAPSLVKEDINAVCCCLKDFLNHLDDKLIPKSKWENFAEAISTPDEATKINKLYQALSTLPQANRDTLAFLILHLQRVACSTECKMPISNLANVFAPTIVGRPDLDYEKPELAFTQNQISITVMEQLLQLPAEYWRNFIKEPPPGVFKTPSTLRNTPSTESLMRKTSRKFLHTPRSGKKFFGTPPSIRNHDK
ncbi:rac GTPase-activating protein 1-like [Planococcus citri]|uniref:rac GTPase-activating protein 1-like n=1 Tax=Planococcus citri TaxID=170843 RepID=UPI0031F844AA